MKVEYVCERSAAEVRIADPAGAYAVLKRYTKKRQEHFIALVGIGSAPAVESTIYTVPMLAGLMRGFKAEEYCVIAAVSGYEYMTDIGACRVLVA